MKKKDTKQLPIDEAVKTEVQKIKEQQERQALIFSPDTFLPQKNVDKELEQFQLYNGFVGTIKDLRAMIRRKPRGYNPMFPNKIPFFKLVFKLNGWGDKDHTSYTKPWVVGRHIRRFIYRRFPENILPTLLDMPNPALFRYIKRYKLFQYLNDDGLIMLEGFIWDAIRVMEISSDWKDFEKIYCTMYNLDIPPIQQNLFEETK